MVSSDFPTSTMRVAERVFDNEEKTPGPSNGPDRERNVQRDGESVVTIEGTIEGMLRAASSVETVVPHV